MLSRASIIRGMAIMSASNLRPPEAWKDPEARELTVAVWLDLLGHLAQVDFDGAIRAHLRQPSPWWPTPGQILALVAPPPAPPQIEQRETPYDALEAWQRGIVLEALDAADLWRTGRPIVDQHLARLTAIASQLTGPAWCELVDAQPGPHRRRGALLALVGPAAAPTGQGRTLDTSGGQRAPARGQPAPIAGEGPDQTRQVLSRLGLGGA